MKASHKLHKSVYVKICRLPQGTSSELTLHVCGRCRILCKNLAISVNGVGPKGGDDASMWHITLPTQCCGWYLSLDRYVRTPVKLEGKSHQIPQIWLSGKDVWSVTGRQVELWLSHKIVICATPGICGCPLENHKKLDENDKNPQKSNSSKHKMKSTSLTLDENRKEFKYGRFAQTLCINENYKKIKRKS